jgi:clan AA aspartic protease (TIGR02281 family)
MPFLIDDLFFLAAALTYPVAAVAAKKLGDDQGSQPSYRPAQGYPPIQYAQANPQPVQYGQPHAYRAQIQVGEAYAYPGGDGAFYAEVALPSSTSGAFATTMRYDSGASHVILNHSDARAMGLDLRRQRFDVVCGGLSSSEYTAPVLIPIMGVGNIRIHDVEAFITQRDCGVSLLGQSALRQFRSITQEGDLIVFRR